jgi:hypothetical protein
MINREKIKNLFKLTKEEYANYSLAYKLIKRFFYTYSVIVVVLIVAVFAFGIDIIKEGDFQNWTSFVFELGLGAYMAIAILTYENFQKEKAKKQQKKKREYGLQKMKLLLTRTKEEFEDEDYDNAKDTFDQIIVTLTIVSDVLETEESKQILELSEIGKLFCKQKGGHSIQPNRTLPFTTSIPANKGALFQKFDQVIQMISKNESKS